MSPLGGMGLFVGTSAQSPTPGVLTVDRTIHVDSVLGNDIGDGSAALPFATLARAWAERLTYGELRAKLIVQLHGVGPYTMPVMGASVCGDGGFFVIVGDSSADTIAVSSTFTGDLSTSTFVVPATAGLGSDTHKGKFLWITSGNCVGARCLILSNTDTSITLPITDFRSGAIVNGDTFQIRVPGTVINIPATASGQSTPGATNWIGGAFFPAGFASVGGPIRHIIAGVSFTGNTLVMRDSAFTLIGCKCAVSFQPNNCKYSLGGLGNGYPLGVGTDTASNLLAGWGFSTTGSIISSGQALFSGVYSTTSIIIGSGSVGDLLEWNGGRTDGTLTVNGGRMEGFNSFMSQISKAWIATVGGQLRFNTGTWVFAVTTGSCIDLRDCALGVMTSGATVSGGTSDAAGFGTQARSGARMCYVNRAPVLTGGTAGADIKAESTAAIANSALGSNGTSTLDAVTQAIVMRVAA